MANKVHVKKGDTVLVLSGKDKGKKGKVLTVVPDDNMVVVEGVNMSTKHRKPRSQFQQGGIVHQESPVNSSKVMLICEKCKSPTKIAHKFIEDGQKARVCKKCNEVIDIINKGKE